MQLATKSKQRNLSGSSSSDVMKIGSLMLMRPANFGVAQEY